MYAQNFGSIGWGKNKQTNRHMFYFFRGRISKDFRFSRRIELLWHAKIIIWKWLCKISSKMVNHLTTHLNCLVIYRAR